MIPRRDSATTTRAESHAAVSIARTISKSHPDRSYDELIESSPFEIRSARELLQGPETMAPIADDVAEEADTREGD